MALIKCNECEKEFSDKAAACPNCGYPNKTQTASQPQIIVQTVPPQGPPLQEEQKKAGCLTYIGGAVVLLILLSFISQILNDKFIKSDAITQEQTQTTQSTAQVAASAEAQAAAQAAQAAAQAPRQ